MNIIFHNIFLFEGNVDLDNSLDDSQEDINSFYYQKHYDTLTARFVDPESDLPCKPEVRHKFCPVCTRCTYKQHRDLPRPFEKIDTNDTTQLHYEMVKYNDQEIRIGNTVYLQPKSLKFKFTIQNTNPRIAKRDNVDEDMFPEYYRKYNDKVKGSHFDTPEPFDIGYITSIFSTSNIKLCAYKFLHIKVKKMYRPENTHKWQTLQQRTDNNMLYWSDEGKLKYVDLLNINCNINSFN